MTPEKQLIKHDPANGFYGDCWRTVIASILDMLPQDVPHFNNGRENSVIEQHTQEWLSARGLGTFEIPFFGNTELSVILEQSKISCKNVPCFLAGQSAIGVNHVVIVMNGEIFNPSVNDIVGPCDDGYWWLGCIAVGKDWLARTEPAE